MSNTNILEEYNWIIKNTGLTIEDLEAMNQNAVQCIFGTEEQKRRVQARLQRIKEEEVQTGGGD